MDLKLTIKCPECDGVGGFDNPAWNDLYNQYKTCDLEDLPEFPPEKIAELEQELGARFFVCSVCYGAQRILTDEGEQVLEAIEVYQKIMKGRKKYYEQNLRNKQ